MKTKYEKLWEHDMDIAALCSKGTDLFYDFEIMTGKDRGTYKNKEKDYKKQLKELRKVLDNIEKLVVKKK